MRGGSEQKGREKEERVNNLGWGGGSAEGYACAPHCFKTAFDPPLPSSSTLPLPLSVHDSSLHHYPLVPLYPLDTPPAYGFLAWHCVKSRRKKESGNSAFRREGGGSLSLIPS